MFKRPVRVELTYSGHYCINRRDESNPNESEIKNEDDILTVTENMTTKEKLKQF